jgi:hypothetical protein
VLVYSNNVRNIVERIEVTVARHTMNWMKNSLLVACIKKRKIPGSEDGKNSTLHPRYLAQGQLRKMNLVYGGDVGTWN